MPNHGKETQVKVVWARSRIKEQCNDGEEKKKRSENNISDWTGLKFCNAIREYENRIKWSEKFAKCVAPQWSP